MSAKLPKCLQADPCALCGRPAAKAIAAGYAGCVNKKCPQEIIFSLPIGDWNRLQRAICAAVKAAKGRTVARGYASAASGRKESDMLPCNEPKIVAPEVLAKEIEKLADFILAKIPGEPSCSESAVDTAIRLLKPYTKPHVNDCAQKAECMELVCMGCVEARMLNIIRAMSGV